MVFNGRDALTGQVQKMKENGEPRLGDRDVHCSLRLGIEKD